MPEYLKKAARTSTDDAGDVSEAVRAILAEIEAGGENAARAYAAKFDRYDGDIVLSRDEIEAAAAKVPQKLKDDIRFAHDNVRRFAEAQKATIGDMEYEVQPGLIAGQKAIPVRAATKVEGVVVERQVDHGSRRKPHAVVQTSASGEVGRHLKRHWSEVAADRITGAYPGQFSYNVFTVSRDDFERIRQLHLAYFHAMRQIVSESSPNEVVGVVNVQLFALDDKPEPSSEGLDRSTP